MKLMELLADTAIPCPAGLSEMEITGIAYDSRQVKKGHLFICIKGYDTDGHKYASDAVLKGAAIIISEHELHTVKVPVLIAVDTRKALSKIAANYYNHPTRDIRIFGVTGTNGKTTITYMLKSVLDAAEESCGILGTIAYKFGDKVYESINTTPESLELQKLFSEMHIDGIKNCVMEVSSHSLSLSRTADIHFDYSIFTNLTPDHMDFHEDLDDYFDSKKKLFYQTATASTINIDDRYGRQLFDELERNAITSLSHSLKSKEANFYGEILTSTEKGSEIRLFQMGKSLGTFKIRTPGTFSIYNALATASICLIAGLDFKVVKKGLEILKGVPGRFELVENARDMTVIVDYAHTPDALEKVLKTALGFKRGRLICVFGCGGDRDRKKRPMMGKAAGELSDYCIITSDNPRTEDQAGITADIEEGIYDTGCVYEIIENRYEAIRKAIAIYRKGDTLIITGKGHEDYQIIGTVKSHFDDREVAKEIIAAING
jgi:UDP-N-acetylmuramoyl-L-alanyl-D-glutamate--2,6-diaminopimelate ligase